MCVLRVNYPPRSHGLQRPGGRANSKFRAFFTSQINIVFILRPTTPFASRQCALEMKEVIETAPCLFFYYLFVDFYPTVGAIFAHSHKIKVAFSPGPIGTASGLLLLHSVFESNIYTVRY